MNRPVQVRRPGLWLGVTAVIAASVAVWVFPRAMPVLTLGQGLTRQAALQRADSFFRAHDLAPAGARTAVRFQGDDSLRTYVDLAGGGRDTLNALAGGRDVALFTWSVRAFVPRDPHEARVDFATDGRVVGFRRVFAEADERPEVSAEEGLRLAEDVLVSWLGQDTTRWRLATSSYETLKTSGRVDRTYTFERRDMRVADAPVRLDVVIAGDTPAQGHPYVMIPESFSRRYGEMRSANDLLASVAQVGFLALIILGAFTLRRFALVGSVRWRPSLLVGAVVGVLLVAAWLNQLPGSWFGYDTATSPATFRANLILFAVLNGAGMGLLVGLTLAAAEAAARHAFPRQIDWWKAWEHRGTRAVAGRVAAGYVVALMGLAYVALFYLLARNVLGWWVPSELLDDPNLIATPMPWLSAVAVSLQAGVFEEALFRVLPLSLLALWVGDRPHRWRWMALGVVATALVFGFAHSNYPSWPAYSRGVELFLDACFWAVLVIWLGPLVTVVAHFSYDLLLFGSFAASGSAPAYRLTAAIVVLVLLAPALAVAWRWLRQRALTELPDEARFVAWKPTPVADREPMVAPEPVRSLTRQARLAAVAVGGVAVLLEIFVPGAPTLGRPFTATRSQALAAADSVAQTHGVDPAAWRRLAVAATDPLPGLARFLVEEDAEDIALRLANSYEAPAWWAVRYVHTEGTAAERAEEWRVRLWPDGSPLDARHLVPDSARGDTVSDEQARSLALAAIAAAGIDTRVLQESKLEATERPARRDVTVTYTDTAMALPGDAAARVWVTLAGDEPLVVRRGVELPETFLRSDRERQSTRTILTLLCGTWLVALAGALTVGVIRRRPPILDDGVLGRRPSLAVVGALALFGMATSLNELPGGLFSYDTAMPWTSWVGNSTLVVLLSAVPALLALGLWLVLSALRRRVGIPLLPPGDDANSVERRRDVLLAGLGLGATLTVLALGLRLTNRGGIPAAPGTVLDQAIPLLGGALAVPMGVVMSVVALGIPALALAGVARGWRLRLPAAAALVAPLLALSYLGAPPSADPVMRTLVPAAVGLAAVVLSVRWWAAFSGWSWIVAGTVNAGFGGLWTLFHSATVAERGAGALTLVMALVLLALAARVPGRWRGVFSSARGAAG